MSLAKPSIRGRREYLSRNIRGAWEVISGDAVTLTSFAFLMLMVFLAITGDYIAPYGATERVVGSNNGILIGAPPSLEHPLGTTDRGYDVFSRLIIGVAPTIFAGAAGGAMIITIGTTVGITAGYFGGWIEDILMRITDMVYSVPLLPLAIVLVALIGVGYFKSILVIGMVLWRSPARVLRAQILQIKERPFILAAKATGISTPQIMLKHLLPNVAPMAILFFAIGVGYTIILQSSLAFLGLVSPFRPSWGIMLQNAYASGQFSSMWWWSVPPGLLLSLTVVATLLFGRGYEIRATQDKSSSLAE